jgi:hypothetical protein
VLLVRNPSPPNPISPRSISSSLRDVRFVSRLTRGIRLDRVGQPVIGTVTEPVYAYDRVVIAVGTKVRGHVAQIDSGIDVRSRARVSERQLVPGEACRPSRSTRYCSMIDTKSRSTRS